MTFSIIISIVAHVADSSEHLSYFSISLHRTHKYLPKTAMFLHSHVCYE